MTDMEYFRHRHGDDDRPIPAHPECPEYRGVKLDDHQSLRRIEDIVKPAIDHVMATDDVVTLFDYCRDPAHPPEARGLCEGKILGAWEAATQERRIRPDVELETVMAHCAGLNSERWRSPWSFCSLFDQEWRAVRRDEVLSEAGRELGPRGHRIAERLTPL